ncbi:c-type cytochrome [Pontibacter silvestris]|uniref:C-type cytochrome n=1 Tax=Pontibacter silvestris TaxID=2305183 RepID=A0ABW4WRC3_9BACT|nr:c-type cytochrome [Pontibacter silvestris]MCC9138587.1 c-type cytochrome [Pontibacter silvestris]
MKKVLKLAGYVAVAFVVIVAAGIIYLQYAFPNVDAAPVITIKTTPELIKRGEYLANNVSVCIDCHSSRDFSRFSAPPMPGTIGKGGEKFDHSMGFPGTFYAKNITADKESGLGNWTDGEIYRAITSGVNKSGDPLFPVMPYKAYSQMTTEDAYAIVAYLRTLQPISNNIPASEADFPMNLILRTMATMPKPTKQSALGDKVSYGKYLLTIAGCPECHTPQEKGTPIEGKFMAGGFEYPFPNGTLRSSNITPDKETGIGTWTEDAFVKRFKMYVDPAITASKLGSDDFNTLMPWKMYAGMKEEDLRAIYKYLMSLEPNKNKVEKFTRTHKDVSKS